MEDNNNPESKSNAIEEQSNVNSAQKSKNDTQNTHNSRTNPLDEFENEEILEIDQWTEDLEGENTSPKNQEASEKEIISLDEERSLLDDQSVIPVQKTIDSEEPLPNLKEVSSEQSYDSSLDQQITNTPDLNDEFLDDQGHLMSNSLRDTIFGEEDLDKAALAEINFDLVDAGRWLLKVIAGPNNGAEFSMHSANSYVIGTDPTSCDIVFHDNSVSRQHARITITADEGISIEDLKSRNQTLVDGEPIKSKIPLLPNSVVTVGTTSFIVYDREGEMQTIISPLLPAIVKVLKEEPAKVETDFPTPIAMEDIPIKTTPLVPEAEIAPELDKTPAKRSEKAAHALGAFIVLGIMAGLLVIIGYGMSTLFKNEPVVAEHATHPMEIINETLKPFPTITPWYNKTTGNLQLMGHVSTSGDKTRLSWSIKSLPFINTIDDKDVIIDEYVWQEANILLSKKPAWKNVTISSPSPGKFLLTGYLQTRNEADQLSEYVASIFPYIDLLEKRITVEEDVVNKANNVLNRAGFKDVSIKMENRSLTLTGGYPLDKEEVLHNSIEELKKIPGVLDVKNLTAPLAPEQSVINISDKYEVTGSSRLGKSYSVVIHGRVITKGDELDGMSITDIKQNAILLEKDGVKYRIDFSR